MLSKNIANTSKMKLTWWKRLYKTTHSLSDIWQ